MVIAKMTLYFNKCMKKFLLTNVAPKNNEVDSMNFSWYYWIVKKLPFPVYMV